MKYKLIMVSTILTEKGWWHMKKLSSLVNIGPKLEERLLNVGITTPEMLRQVGSVEATYRIMCDDPNWQAKIEVIEGAIRGVRWHAVPHEERILLNKKLNNMLDSEQYADKAIR